jgi:hypothetical protein
MTLLRERKVASCMGTVIIVPYLSLILCRSLTGRIQKAIPITGPHRQVALYAPCLTGQMGWMMS